MNKKTGVKSTTTTRGAKRMSVYANLAQKHKTKKDANARKRAEYLASLPKHPLKRLLYRLHPKRVAAYWFSKRGAFMALKILGVGILLAILLVGGLFAYFRKDLDKIRPGEIAKRVQTTVTKYYDRNGALLWEDKGGGNYKLVVESDQISPHMKHATVAIEDKDFFKHHGISISGMARAMFSNASGGQVQGGSTLTQQLIKQVFFAEEAGNRGLGGVPRKIKEIILAIEVERMYNKDQILTLYLNESPYGGPRNGVESAAQSYFGKSAKDLSIAEAALLASIPQNPSYFNPYVAAGHKALLKRQHTVIDYMQEQGYISTDDAKKAKEYDIMANIKPEVDGLQDIKAPHFVLMVRNQLKRELGAAVVGRGGLTVKTTLDWRIQEKLESEMTTFFATGRPDRVRIGNGAATIEDVQTGQIVALAGSRGFNHPGYGQDNAATAFIQPGSSVKPLVYAQLFQNQGNDKQNYGSGSVLKDENIDRLYGAKLQNWDGKFMGDLTIRRSLALSRNVPTVKAAYIIGNGSAVPSVEGMRKMGNTSYCAQEEAAGGYGLSASIGGCGARQIEMVNAYGTLARLGVEKPSASILEVINSQGDTLKKWKDDSTQVIDPQAAYIVNDIISDTTPGVHGVGGLRVPGVRTSAKTGTSDKDTKPKDLWIMSYSPVLSMGLWLGNSDTSTLGTSVSSFGMPIIRNVMAHAHTQVYAQDGKWKPGMWYNRPAGIQQVGGELYPSWWNKSHAQKTEKMTFDRVSKKKATDCTPDGARIEVEITKMIDPITKKEIITAPDGYNANETDDTHSCSDAKPTVELSLSKSGNTYTMTAKTSNGTFPLEAIDFLVDGSSVKSSSLGASGGTQTATATLSSPGQHTFTVTVRDQGYYTGSATKTVTHASSDRSR